MKKKIQKQTNEHPQQTGTAWWNNGDTAAPVIVVALNLSRLVSKMKLRHGKCGVSSSGQSRRRRRRAATFGRKIQLLADVRWSENSSVQGDAYSPGEFRTRFVVDFFSYSLKPKSMDKKIFSCKIHFSPC